jgi:hypothetical protein
MEPDRPHRRGGTTQWPGSVGPCELHRNVVTADKVRFSQGDSTIARVHRVSDGTARLGFFRSRCSAPRVDQGPRVDARVVRHTAGNAAVNIPPAGGRTWYCTGSRIERVAVRRVGAKRDQEQHKCSQQTYCHARWTLSQSFVFHSHPYWLYLFAAQAPYKERSVAAIRQFLKLLNPWINPILVFMVIHNVL